MAKVLKAQNKEVRFSDVEFDKTLEVPTKNGSKLEVIRFVKKAGNTTVYCNKHSSLSWEMFSKFFLSLPDYQQQVNEDDDIEFDI